MKAMKYSAMKTHLNVPTVTSDTEGDVDVAMSAPKGVLKKSADKRSLDKERLISVIASKMKKGVKIKAKQDISYARGQIIIKKGTEGYVIANDPKVIVQWNDDDTGPKAVSNPGQKLSFKVNIVEPGISPRQQKSVPTPEEVYEKACVGLRGVWKYHATVFEILKDGDDFIFHDGQFRYKLSWSWEKRWFEVETSNEEAIKIRKTFGVRGRLDIILQQHSGGRPVYAHAERLSDERDSEGTSGAFSQGERSAESREETAQGDADQDSDDNGQSLEDIKVELDDQLVDEPAHGREAAEDAAHTSNDNNSEAPLNGADEPRDVGTQVKDEMDGATQSIVVFNLDELRNLGTQLKEEADIAAQNNLRKHLVNNGALDPQTTMSEIPIYMRQDDDEDLKNYCLAAEDSMSEVTASDWSDDEEGEDWLNAQTIQKIGWDSVAEILNDTTQSQREQAQQQWSMMVSALEMQEMVWQSMDFMSKVMPVNNPIEKKNVRDQLKCALERQDLKLLELALKRTGEVDLVMSEETEEIAGLALKERRLSKELDILNFAAEKQRLDLFEKAISKLSDKGHTVDPTLLEFVQQEKDGEERKKVKVELKNSPKTWQVVHRRASEVEVEPSYEDKRGENTMDLLHREIESRRQEAEAEAQLQEGERQKLKEEAARIALQKKIADEKEAAERKMAKETEAVERKIAEEMEAAEEKAANERKAAEQAERTAENEIQSQASAVTEVENRVEKAQQKVEISGVLKKAPMATLNTHLQPPGSLSVSSDGSRNDKRVSFDKRILQKQLDKEADDDSLKAYIKEQYDRAMLTRKTADGAQPGILITIPAIPPESELDETAAALILEAKAEAVSLVLYYKDDVESAWNDVSKCFDLQHMIWKAMDMIRSDGKATGKHWTQATQNRNASLLQEMVDRGQADQELNFDCQQSIEATLTANNALKRSNAILKAVKAAKWDEVLGWLDGHPEDDFPLLGEVARKYATKSTHNVSVAALPEPENIASEAEIIKESISKKMVHGAKKPMYAPGSPPLAGAPFREGRGGKSGKGRMGAGLDVHEHDELGPVPHKANLNFGSDVDDAVIIKKAKAAREAALKQEAAAKAKTAPPEALNRRRSFLSKLFSAVGCGCAGGYDYDGDRSANPVGRRLSRNPDMVSAGKYAALKGNASASDEPRTVRARVEVRANDVEKDQEENFSERPVAPMVNKSEILEKQRSLMDMMYAQAAASSVTDRNS
eukprot:GEMP01003467.1.p1 GENE.GEMP01003467.1~~GEMP01003467.1.p1  ORF type:complete len:1229 (+),score=362.66 GEMP01003467.1:308-3994(+)